MRENTKSARDNKSREEKEVQVKELWGYAGEEILLINKTGVTWPYVIVLLDDTLMEWTPS